MYPACPLRAYHHVYALENGAHVTGDEFRILLWQVGINYGHRVLRLGVVSCSLGNKVVIECVINKFRYK